MNDNHQQTIFEYQLWRDNQNLFLVIDNHYYDAKRSW